jgi:hypothetical protein
MNPLKSFRYRQAVGDLYIAIGFAILAYRHGQGAIAWGKCYVEELQDEKRSTQRVASF